MKTTMMSTMMATTRLAAGETMAMVAMMMVSL
jgi:hypothetical protein